MGRWNRCRNGAVGHADLYLTPEHATDFQQGKFQSRSFEARVDRIDYGLDGRAGQVDPKDQQEASIYLPVQVKVDQAANNIKQQASKTRPMEVSIESFQSQDFILDSERQIRDQMLLCHTQCTDYHKM